MRVKGYKLIIPTFDTDTEEMLGDYELDLYNPQEAKEGVELLISLIEEQLHELEHRDMFIEVSKN